MQQQQQPEQQQQQQPGSQAARQPSSQAAKQPGSQAAKQPASQRKHSGIKYVDFSLVFIRKMRFRDKKYQYFVGFIRFSENEVAVAAAAWCERPPFSSHSITFFVNVDIS